MRSPVAIVKTTKVDTPIPPEAAPADTIESVSVCTVMLVMLPAVAAPIVMPLRVMVKAVLDAIPALTVVMTKTVAAGEASCVDIPVTDECAV